MQRIRSGALRALPLIALAALLLATSSCRPELLVRLTTQVFHDGSLERRLEVRGWTSKGEVPDEDDWLASSVGLRLADPDAWSRVEKGTDRLTAEGFFAGAADLPPALSYDTDEGRREDRLRTELKIEEKIVVRRWVYREYHGDPFSRADSERALDALVELLAEMLESELQRHLGDELDTSPARRFLQSEARSLALALIGVERRMRGGAPEEQRIALWSQVLAQHGVPTRPVEDAEQFWELHGPALVEWCRLRTAEELSSSGFPVSPDDLLGFWPDPEDPTSDLDAWSRRTWTDPERIHEEIESHFSAIGGYYGQGTSPRFRFEVGVTMPGVLLGTNGTPDGSTARWLIRDEDMSLSEFILRAESADLLAEPLVALGARRALDTKQLIQLVDLLWKRDPSGELIALLGQAVERGSLELLREESSEELLPLAWELADLFDPNVAPGDKLPPALDE